MLNREKQRCFFDQEKHIKRRDERERLKEKEEKKKKVRSKKDIKQKK